MIPIKHYWLIIMFVLCAYTPSLAQKFDYTYKGVEFVCKLSKQTKEVTITRFSVKAKDVVIPSIVSYSGQDYPVKTVDVFMNGVNYLAETLNLEDGIENIEDFAFNEFRLLQSVVLPPSIRHIGRKAFRNHDGLQLFLASNIDENALRKGKEISVAAGGKPSPHQPLLAQTSTGRNSDDNKIDKGKRKMSMPDKMLSKKKEKPSVVIYERPGSTIGTVKTDVDMNIPVTSQKNVNTYCVIIANEHYTDVANVDFAKHDGEVFKEYCIKTLGIPEKNVKMHINATYTTIRRAVHWMVTTAQVTGSNSKFILYYAGHGIPSEKDKTAYLLPSDGLPKDVETCYSLRELYSQLGKMNTQRVTVLLDACFTGMKRGEIQPLVAARAVAIETREEHLSGNVIVISAASGDETAMSYQDKQHGLFTYYLLNKLKDTRGKVSLGELFESISSEVQKASWIENEKLQTPSVNVSENMRLRWENLSF